MAQAAYCMTSEMSPDLVADAMRAGCTDVVEKPLSSESLDRIVASLNGGAAAELKTWRRVFASSIVGEDPAFLEQLKVVRSVADTSSTVLIIGETGTGKELIARAVHDASLRAEGPFVALNCAAIPESLIEDELFGHARGAFTGAMAAREGRIAAANGGTLFLDEIGDMPLNAQAKLLRVLQERMLTPVGSDQATKLDIRVIAATNKDLETMAGDGTFRPDLLFRISVIRVNLPALRDRRDDIVPIAEYFVQEANARHGRYVWGLDASAKALLTDHIWAGNVRALGNAIERAVILKRSGHLTAPDFALAEDASERRAPAAVPAPVAPCVAIKAKETEAAADLNLRMALERLEREMIGLALERASGNRTEAAALLGLNRTTLVEKMRKIA